ncbi:Gfo/Idh/MocA family oxidoreductase [Geitlerinema splendidum]|jgi:predicted dehydrogenase|nr:Gfo/Idh/MocA family oxidoreductase [Geitlerinema splendidum]
MIPLRFGVIGCGGIAQIMHLPHLHSHDDRFTIAALSDTHAPTLAAVASHYHIAAEDTYQNAEDLLARPDIEAVGIFHGGSHRDSVIAALKAGKHVFCEKPAGWNLREVTEMAEYARQSDRILQMGYHKLYDPGFEYACEAVQNMRDLGFVRISVLHPADEAGWAQHRVRRGDGRIIEGMPEIGEFSQQVDAQRQGLAEGPLAAAVDEALGERRHDPRLRLAYGLMIVSLIHQTYTLHGFLGLPQRVIHTDVWRDGLSIHVLAAYSDSLRVSLDWHWLGHLKDYKEEYAFFGNHDRVYFTLPSPYARNFPSPVTIQGHEGELTWEKKVVVNHQEAFERELLAFYDNVRAGRQPFTNIETAVEHHRFIQQMIDAAR